MLRACVIGMGPIGTINHAVSYQSSPDVELVAVCDIIKERADNAAARFNVPAYYDVDTMLKEMNPDICSITTGGYEYAGDHFIPTMQALEAGCHVLCEKPISDSIEHAEKMVATAERLNRCFGINFNHRFTDAARQAKKWQNEGRLGELLFCNMALWIGKPGNFESEYYHLKALNPHSIEIMRYFCGDIDEVHCYAMKSSGRNIWSSASVNMKFKNGIVGHLTSSYDIERGHPMERCEVAGVDGRLVFEDMWREATLYPRGSMVKEVYTNPVFGGYREFFDTFENRIHSFVKQVADGVEPSDIDGSGRQGLEASRVIHAAIESLKTGLPVKVNTITR